MKKSNKRKIQGICVIFAGILLGVLGGWLGSKVWGTALLYTDAVLGKVAKYYWVVLLIAVFVIFYGLRLFKKKVAGETSVENEITPTTELPATNPEEKFTTDSETKSETVPEIKTETDLGDNVPEKTAVEEVKIGNNCPKCGSDVKDGMKFCIKCGEKLS